MGDLNADLLDTKDSDAITLTALTEELSPQIVQHSATHQQNPNVSQKWIDHMCVDENDIITGFRNRVLPSFGKHAVIDVTIDVFTPAPQRDSSIHRDFRNITSEQLNDFLLCCDWSGLENAQTILEGAIHCLNENSKTVLFELAPEKTIRPRESTALWIGPELGALIRERDAPLRCQERYWRNQRKCPELDNECLRLSKEVDERMKKDRESFIESKISEALGQNRDIWEGLHKLGFLPKGKKEPLYGLNAHFAGVSVSSDENVEKAMDDIMSALEEGFKFRPTNFDEVVLAIEHFSLQARGVDGVPQCVIAKALPALGDLIVHIFNSSFAHSVFPETWKRAQLIALKKTVAPSAESDFRPIAIQCPLAKVVEKLAHDQITEYLKGKNLFDRFQLER